MSEAGGHPCHSPSAWRSVAHTVAFAASLAALYRLVPRFLVQNHDGQNLYNYIAQTSTWQRGWLDAFIFTPLHGSGDIIWPVNPVLFPMFYGFRLVRDPALRILSLQVLAGASIFAACLIFYRALRVRPGVVVAASWICSAMFLLQSVEYLSGTDVLQPIVWAYLGAAAFVSLGRRPWPRTLLSGLEFQIAMLFFVLSHPTWHIVGLPALGCLLAALLAKSDTPREAVVKSAALIMAVAIQGALGTYTALYYTFADTARTMLSSEFPGYAHIPWIAGHLFRSSATEIALGMCLIFGLTAGGLAEVCARVQTARAVTLATAVFYGLATVAAAWFLYSGYEWRAPKLAYMMQFAYPLAALFVVVGLQQLARRVTTSPAVEAPSPRPHLRRSLPWLATAAYLTWHYANGFGGSPGLYPAVGFALGGLWLLRRGWVRAATVVAVPIVLLGLYQNAWLAFGPTTDDRFDGRQRMGLVPNPLIEFLASRVGLAPGRQFAGYADDVYARLSAPNLNEEIIRQWVTNWQRYGNGHKLFAWNVFGIPTITEYTPYIRPLYFEVFAKLLNEPTDQQWVNYLTITRPDLRILSLLGVRYLVTDTPTLPNTALAPVMRWERFHLFELPHANLASYSPTASIIVATAAEALARMADEAFDPRSIVIVTRPLPHLVPANRPASLIFQRGGYAVHAHSSGRSLIVLPVQFSHCFATRITSGDTGAQLLRVNLVQTGLLFDREVALEARLARWPTASPDCQKRDYDDSRQLRVRDLGRGGESGTS